jgi:hypothetical protein
MKTAFIEKTNCQWKNVHEKTNLKTASERELLTKTVQMYE